MHRYPIALKVIAAIGTIAVVIAVSVGIGVFRPPLPSPETAPSAPATFTIQLSGEVTLSSAGAIFAKADLLSRHGLRIDLVPGVDDTSALDAVAASDHVIGVASAQSFIKARANGSPIVAFAAAYISSPVEFFALAKTTLRAAADLEGKRIGLSPSLENGVILNAFIAQNALRQSTLTIVESSNAVADLLAEKIDIAVGRWNVEGQELLRSNAPYRSLSPDSFGVHAMGAVYFANERAFLSPANLEKILAAISAGWGAAYSASPRALSIIAQAMKSELSSGEISRFMDQQRRFLRPAGARFGEIDKRRFSALQDLLLKQRVIDRPIDLSRAVNFDILSEIYRQKLDTPLQVGP